MAKAARSVGVALTIVGAGVVLLRQSKSRSGRPIAAPVAAPAPPAPAVALEPRRNAGRRLLRVRWRSRRVLVGLVASVLVFSAAAFAASLTLAPETLGAQDAAMSVCDANGVTTSYTTAFDATDNRFEVTTVTVKGIADACNGLTVKVQLTNSAGAAISGATGSGTVSTAAGVANAREVAITLTTPASAEDAANVHVVVG